MAAPSQENLLLNRMLQALDTLAEISARLASLERMNEQLNKIVREGNGAEPLIIQAIRLRTDIAQLQKRLDEQMLFRGASVAAAWNFGTVLVQSTFGFLGATVALVLQHYLK